MESHNAWSTSTLAGVLGAAGPHLVALVGGGGKSTALLRLVREKTHEHGGVVATTTTMMFARQLADAGPLLYEDDDAERLAKHMVEVLGRSDAVALAHSRAPGGKVKGLTPAVVDALWEAGAAGSIVVEADGSRGLPIKAFGVTEPQLPARTTVAVVLAGLDAVGRPLDGEYVHRAELLTSVLNVAPGDPVTPALLGRAAALQVARVRSIALEARVVVLLNKADDGERLRLADAAATALLAASDGLGTFARPDRIVAGSVLQDSYALLHG